jgi:hypothetical protein
MKIKRKRTKVAKQNKFDEEKNQNKTKSTYISCWREVSSVFSVSCSS